MGKTILTPNQKLLLDEVANSRVLTNSFYLTGGTALSEFYLNHRLSEDLDFFTENELNEVEIAAWVKTIAQKTATNVEFETLRGQLIYYFKFPKDTVKIEFAYFPFPVLGSYLRYKTLKVSSLEDIAVNKLQTILTRSRSRDYFDLFEILKREKLSIEKVGRDYRLKFDVFIPDEELARRFTAVLDAKDQPKFLKKVAWEKVVNFFLSEAKKLESKILK